jgi:hypothetical protein
VLTTRCGNADKINRTISSNFCVIEEDRYERETENVCILFIDAVNR